MKETFAWQSEKGRSPHGAQRNAGYTLARLKDPDCASLDPGYDCRAATGAPPKSLIRMFGLRGNPQARNLFSVIGYLQKRAGVRLSVAEG